MRKQKTRQTPCFLLPCGLYVNIGLDVAFNRAVSLLKVLNAVSYEDENVTVDASALVIGNVRKLFKHFFFDPYRHTFDSHNNTPK